MTSCEGCGSALGDDDRFCGTCGTPARTEGAVGLLDPAPRTDLGALRRDTGRGRTLALVVGVALLAAVGWLAVDSFGGDDGVDTDALMELGGADESSAADDEGDGDGDSDLATDPADGTSTEPSTGSTFDVDAAPDALDPQPDLAGRSLFMSFETGVGSANGPVWQLDLGTGTWTDTGHVGIPLIVMGDDLVVLEEESDSVRLVAVSVAGGEADDEAVVLSRQFSFVIDDRRQPPEDGSVWLLASSGVWQFEYRRIDLATGEILERFDAPPPNWISIDAPSLLSVGGEIFSRSDDGEYESVGTGRVVAATTDWALVETCDAPGSCRVDWRQGPDLEPIDRPVPDDLGNAQVFITDNGSTLIYTGEEGTRLYDVDVGEIRNSRFALFGSPPSVLSRDQQYVVLPLADPAPPREASIVVIDLDGYQAESIGVVPNLVTSVVWGPGAAP